MARVKKLLSSDTPEAPSDIAPDSVPPEPIVIVCIDCRQAFPFTVGEQEFFKEHDFPPPKRCPMCRKWKKFSNQYGRIMEGHDGGDGSGGGSQ